MAHTYTNPIAGLPDQSTRLDPRAIFTTAYVVIPRSVMRDIVTSYLPYWHNMRCWILAKPLTGFCETFSQYVVEVQPQGGSDKPELQSGIEAVLLVTQGQLSLQLDGTAYTLEQGSYVYISANSNWSVKNNSKQTAFFHWVRKRYEAIEGYEAPQSFVTHVDKVENNAMPETQGRWATKRFVDPQDLRHDMHVNIVHFDPGAKIPFSETHIMEHGLFVLEGRALYNLNNDWVEVEAGDFMWLRAFCPQSCVAMGDAPFRYLLYKDVNRHAKL